MFFLSLLGLFFGFSVLTILQSVYLVFCDLLLLVFSLNRIFKLSVDLEVAKDKKEKTKNHMIRAVKLALNEFFGKTSIHGLFYLVDKKRAKTGKVFWIFIWVFVAGYCVSVIGSFKIKQENSVRTFISTDYGNIKTIPFPAVTFFRPKTIFGSFENPNKTVISFKKIFTSKGPGFSFNLHDFQDIYDFDQ